MSVSAHLRVLGLDPEEAVTVDALRAARKRKFLECHPDKGGSHEDFLRVQQAFEACHAAATAGMAPPPTAAAAACGGFFVNGVAARCFAGSEASRPTVVHFRVSFAPGGGDAFDVEWRRSATSTDVHRIVRVVPPPPVPHQPGTRSGQTRQVTTVLDAACKARTVFKWMVRGASWRPQNVDVAIDVARMKGGDKELLVSGVTAQYAHDARGSAQRGAEHAAAAGWLDRRAVLEPDAKIAGACAQLAASERRMEQMSSASAARCLAGAHLIRELLVGKAAVAPTTDDGRDNVDDATRAEWVRRGEDAAAEDLAEYLDIMDEFSRKVARWDEAAQRGD